MACTYAPMYLPVHYKKKLPLKSPNKIIVITLRWQKNIIQKQRHNTTCMRVHPYESGYQIKRDLVLLLLHPSSMLKKKITPPPPPPPPSFHTLV